MKQKNNEAFYALTHPGTTLKQLLNQKNMSQRELAVRTGLTEAYLSSLINCKKPLSVGTAKKIEYALGYTAESWLTIQAEHDLGKYSFEERSSITVKEQNVLKKLEQITLFMQENKMLSQTGDPVSLVIELRQKMKVANLAVIPESFQTGLFDKPGKITNPYQYYSCIGLCEYIASQITGSIPFDQEKLKEELPDLEALPANSADLEAIKNNLKDCGIRLFYLPRFSELELEGYVTMTADEAYTLFIFEQSGNLAKCNNILMRCINKIATGIVISKMVFDRQRPK